MNYKNRIIGCGEADPKTLTANPRNYRKHPDNQQKAMQTALEKVGWIQDVIVNKNTGHLIDGHLRVETALRNKEQTIPVKYVDLTEDEEKVALATFDPLTAMAEQDDAILKELLAGIEEDIDLAQFHDDFADLMKPEHTEEELDAVPDVPQEAVTKRGDMYRLGDHVLMCGDSTSADDVARLMQGEKADLCLTDPPYGVKIVNVTVRERAGKVGGDGYLHFGKAKSEGADIYTSERQSRRCGKVGSNNYVESTLYAEIIGDDTTDTAREAYKLMKDISMNQIVFGGNYFTDFLPPSPCWIVWDKENTGNFADVELAHTSFKKSAKIYRWVWNGLSRKGNRREELNKRIHPTQKPVGMFKEILSDFSKEGDIVLDLFGGSGSTLIACEETGRKCRMMELAPEYCDVIIKRWENLTGKKAERISTPETA